MEKKAVVELKDISKSFPGVRALDHVNLKIYEGTVHALLGENGAGKSTLMKILSGMYTEYEGKILFDGQEIRFRSEKDALEKGIAIVPQELNPIPELTIAENIFLGREMTNGLGLIRYRKQYEATQTYMKKLGLDYDAGMKMSQLSVAQKQMVEIIKAITRNARVIIMDEPTSALTGAETEYLFEQIEALKKTGISIVFISHKLDEVYRICDEATVLRDGQWIRNVNLADVDEDTLISMMVGRSVQEIYPPLFPHKEEVVLEVEGLKGDRFSDISFSIRAGEILGFSGMMGSGRSEIARSIFGMDRLKSGTVSINGKQVMIRDTHSAIKNGIAMISEDRAVYGFVGLQSIRSNIALPNCDRFANKGFIKKGELEKESADICNVLHVKAPDLATKAGTLSGGNQQKVVLAKWLIRNIKVLILDEPTRGIDVGAKQEIYKLITDLAKEGMAILLISSELPEVLAMSHRVKVLVNGSFAGEFTHEEVTSDKVMKAIVEGGSKV